MQIMGLLGLYFDAVVVFVTSHLILFRFFLAILCKKTIMKSSAEMPRVTFSPDFERM